MPDIVPVTGDADVRALLPAFLHPEDPAAVRDAIFAALVQILLAYQDRSAWAAAQSDLLRARGRALTAACAERGIFRQADEEDEPLRMRALTAPNLVSPTAILAAANSILTPYTAVLPQYSEAAQDRWFVGAGAPRTWRAGIYRHATVPRSPYYPERLYPEDAAANGGYARRQSSPGAARVFSDTVGRYFLLRIPDLSPLDQSLASAYGANASGVAVTRMFIGRGSPTNATFFRRVGASSLGVYQAVANAVDRIKGASIRWQLLVDPKLR